MEEKLCSRCGQNRPLIEYYGNDDYRRPDCKDCERRRARERYAAKRPPAAPAPPGFKRCTGDCGRTLPLDQFHKDKKRLDGKNGRCKECVLRYQYARAALAVESGVSDLLTCSQCGEVLHRSEFHNSSSSITGKQSFCKPCGKRRKQELAKLDPEGTKRRRRIRRLKRHYGLTLDGFSRLLISQGSQCAGCKTDDPGVKGWQVDHDHACCPGDQSCGACICAILCSRCNLLIGLADDNPALLIDLSKYVAETRSISAHKTTPD